MNKFLFEKLRNRKIEEKECTVLSISGTVHFCK